MGEGGRRDEGGQGEVLKEIIQVAIRRVFLYRFLMIASAYSWVLALPPRSPVRN